MMVASYGMDYEKAIRVEKEKRSLQRVLRHTVELLAEDERLGEPRRDGDRIVVPIVRPAEHSGRHDVDPVSLRALVEAWINEA